MHTAGLIVGILLVLIIVAIFLITLKQSLNDCKVVKIIVAGCQYVLDGNYDPDRTKTVFAIVYKELSVFIRKNFSSDQTKLLNNLEKQQVLPVDKFLTPDTITKLSKKNTKFNKYDFIQVVTLTCRSANKNTLNKVMVQRIYEMSDVVGINRYDIKNFMTQVLNYDGD